MNYFIKYVGTKITKVPKFDIYFGQNLKGKYKIIELIPTCSFIIDNQFSGHFMYADDTMSDSYKEYSIIIGWLGFYVEFSLNIQTPYGTNN